MRSGWSAVLALFLAGACSPVYLTTTPGAGRPPDHRPVERESGRADPRPPAASPAARELAAVLGTLVWPLAVDRAAVLSSQYGVRQHPADGAERFHAGLDLRAREGTPVYAAADGQVVRSGIAGAYGNVVVIDHGGGLVSLSGHHRENLVAHGERVRRGQVIGLVGHTGNATGDHLHFELRWRGGTVDPSIVLPRLGASVVAR